PGTPHPPSGAVLKAAGERVRPRTCRFLLDPFVFKRDHPQTEEEAMKYMMLINLGPKARDWQSLTDEERSALQAGFQALNQTPGVTPGIGLAPPETATTVRVQDGKTLTTDGPYVETKEALDGFFTLEADDLDAAIEVASKVPAASLGGAIEIRPTQDWTQS
ncbi:MAG: YciI family protein, partial [Solirubrobacteraceae bacterium]